MNNMTIKIRFFVEDRLVKLVNTVEDYIQDNKIDVEDIIKIEHSRVLNNSGEIVTTFMFVYKTK
jgi:hypothetical protein